MAMCKQKKYHLRSPPRFTLCNLLLILLVALQTWKECEGRIGNGATCAGKKVAIPFGCHQNSWSCCGSKPYCNRSPGSLMARQACCGGRLIDLGHLSCSKGMFICCGGKAMCSRNNRRQACCGHKIQNHYCNNGGYTCVNGKPKCRREFDQSFMDMLAERKNRDDAANDFHQYDQMYNNDQYDGESEDYLGMYDAPLGTDREREFPPALPVSARLDEMVGNGGCSLRNDFLKICNEKCDVSFCKKKNMYYGKVHCLNCKENCIIRVSKISC